ncbi:curli-like amyloid fiber formation chaperone CsgH [Pelagibacterium montanilacus]|uniref:curli-like amyloid fiber formation chaperone CsgH n=1 Tax=Pelagibacterium montanilacus TaxID=2185280 RepID=UPI000F8EAAD4|nr:curli-like amyloid fiber formation chaperone CsgH [Pelagibacterium montanilacus]
MRIVKTIRANAAIIAVSAVAIIGVAGATQAGGSFTGAGTDATECAIATTAEGGMTRIKALYQAGQTGWGTYRLEVESVGGPNRSTISQGGEFSAGPDEAVTLGSVNLGGQGATYDARLSIEIGGKSYACSGKVGSRA